LQILISTDLLNSPDKGFYKTIFNKLLLDIVAPHRQSNRYTRLHFQKKYQPTSTEDWWQTKSPPTKYCL